MDNEVWRTIPGFPNYEVSSVGRFASKARSYVTSDGVRYDKPRTILKTHTGGIVNVQIDGRPTTRSARKLYRLAFPEAPRRPREHIDPSRAQRGARPTGSA